MYEGLELVRDLGDLIGWSFGYRKIGFEACLDITVLEHPNSSALRQSFSHRNPTG